MLSRLAIQGYRSLRDFIVPLEGLNLVTGPNGSGETRLAEADSLDRPAWQWPSR